MSYMKLDKKKIGNVRIM